MLKSLIKTNSVDHILIPKKIVQLSGAYIVAFVSVSLLTELSILYFIS